MDKILQTLARYVANQTIDSKEAYATARACLADSLGCGILSLQYPACTKLLGPVVPDTQVPEGSRVPGTSFVLDPIRAAFNIGSMIRWLDYNDTWLAAEWGHPSDNLGALIGLTDYMQQHTVHDLLTACIKAHEIQGVLALSNSFNRIGFDHVFLVKIASAAVATHLLGGTESQIADTLSQAFIDVGPLRTYRHAPNTGSRKSWAAGDATARGLQLAYFTMQGEMGYSTALTAPDWGFQDVMQPITLERELGSYVMENILFKISFPAEFHAQTAVEAAIKLYPVSPEEVESIEIQTQESCVRIIDKKGPLKNPADRDHCVQYMVAIGLLFGELTADHYEDEHAQDPRIDELREKMVVVENPRYSRDYLDPEKRSIANAITIRMKDGSVRGPVEVEYPIGHRRRREEGIPLLYEKFEKNLSTRYEQSKVDEVMALFADPEKLEQMAVRDFVSLFV